MSSEDGEMISCLAPWCLQRVSFAITRKPSMELLVAAAIIDTIQILCNLLLFITHAPLHFIQWIAQVNL
jgi:hypothetical protein